MVKFTLEPKSKQLKSHLYYEDDCETQIELVQKIISFRVNAMVIDG